jgi:hypothetical protein
MKKVRALMISLVCGLALAGSATGLVQSQQPDQSKKPESCCAMKDGDKDKEMSCCKDKTMACCKDKDMACCKDKDACCHGDSCSKDGASCCGDSCSMKHDKKDGKHKTH